MKIAINFFKELEMYACAKGVNQVDLLLKTLENSIKEVISSTYHIPNVVVMINKNDNSIKIYKRQNVVETIHNSATDILLSDARKIYNSAELNSTIDVLCDLPSMERIIVRKIKDLFSKKVNILEREIQYEAFKNKVGEIFNVQVKSIEFGNLIVDMGHGTAIIRKEDLIPDEKFAINDRVKAVISHVIRRDVGFQILLSRASNEFLMELLKNSIPEIHDGTIEVKSIARVPGKRAKIAVFSQNPRLEPIGPCVGPDGQRIKSVISELKGERVDVILWSNDKVSFIVNSMSPAEISKIVVQDNVVIAVIPDAQLSIAIGVGGANIKLASKLTGSLIKIVPESEYNKDTVEKTNVAVKKFMNALLIDDIMARFLIGEGFLSFGDILNAEINELASLNGFDENIARELQKRTRIFLENECKKLEISDDLINFDGLDLDMIIKLAENGIKNLSDFAWLDSYEFVEIMSSTMFTEETAGDIIMQARKELGLINEQ